MSVPINTSVIVPTFNGEGKIGPMIDRLLPLITPGRELIVVDDGSRDRTAALLEERLVGHPYARWYSIVNRGRAGARNFGAMQAGGALIVFLDDDIEVPSDFFNRIEQIHRRLPSAWITGTVRQKIVDLPHADFLRFRALLDYDVRGRPEWGDGLVRVESFTTAQLGVSREVFIATGGFCEGLRDGEDFELSVRARDCGYEIFHDTMNIVFHVDFSDFESFIRRQIQYKYGRNSLRRAIPDLYERFPEIFTIKKPKSAERIIRRIFIYNSVWKLLISNKLFYYLPKMVRFKVYDYIISSTVLYMVRKGESSSGGC